MRADADMRPLVDHHRLLRRARGALLAASLIVVVALVVAAVSWTRAYTDRPSPDDATRSALLTATERIVEQTLRVAPNASEKQRDTVAAGLTDPLATRYALHGPDAVLPGTVAGRLTVGADVVDAGVASYTTSAARVLVFIDETLGNSAGSSDENSPTRTPIARWAHMRNVDGNWLLADLTPVGDITR
ncbi:hypothetical protein ND991_06870 [Gordonia sputi]|uniref:hypothetical protein n=1 Tax=Gordonia sputi TaxID=36823 RepID=UPI0020442390|nr:hypothetical protein [Gordonia sputi]MCM3894930.1 hypothetical protein [Gordonia sputi]